LDCLLNSKFSLTPADDGDAFTLSNPTGCYFGKAIMIIVTNNATASGETITYGANYTKMGTVDAAALSAGNSEKTYIGLVCSDATHADVVSISRTTEP
jgi:hypothetical protein